MNFFTFHGTEEKKAVKKKAISAMIDFSNEYFNYLNTLALFDWQKANIERERDQFKRFVRTANKSGSLSCNMFPYQYRYAFYVAEVSENDFETLKKANKNELKNRFSYLKVNKCWYVFDQPDDKYVQLNQEDTLTNEFRLLIGDNIIDFLEAKLSEQELCVIPEQHLNSEHWFLNKSKGFDSKGCQFFSNLAKAKWELYDMEWSDYWILFYRYVAVYLLMVLFLVVIGSLWMPMMLVCMPLVLIGAALLFDRAYACHARGEIKLKHFFAIPESFELKHYFIFPVWNKNDDLQPQSICDVGFSEEDLDLKLQSSLTQ